jgi:hypothetical protein
LGLKDGKVLLRKTNGVKIGVPIQKFARGNLEHIEIITGIPRGTLSSTGISTSIPHFKKESGNIVDESSQDSKRAVALYDYTRCTDEELSVAEDEELILLGEPDGQGWQKVRRITNGDTGWVPENYISTISNLPSKVVS